MRIIDDTGRGVYFTDQGSGTYTGAFKERTTVKVENGNYVWYRLDGRRFVWNANNRLIRIEDPFGNRKTLSYDADGLLLIAITDESSGRSLTLNYNSDNRIESISGPVTSAVPDGIRTYYDYDGNGNLISVTYADGSGFNYEYSDPNDVHNLTAKKDKMGHLISSWTYDNMDRAVSNFTRDGRGVTINYISENEVNVMDAYGITRTYAIWDIDGRKKVTGITGPSGCTGCSDDIVRMEYDGSLRIIEAEYANGLIYQFDDFDDWGNARMVKKAVGTPDEKTTIYTFHPDISARLSQTEPSILGSGSKVTIWDYDNDSNDIPNENPTRKPYRLIRRGVTKDVSGAVIPYEAVTIYTYNSKGQMITVDGPLPGSQDTIAYEYDTFSGDLLAAVQPLAGSIVFSDYDGAGQVGRIIDENGNATVFSYDGRGRIKTVVKAADDSVTAYTYNTAGDLTRVTDSDGIVSIFSYDTDFGRLAGVIDPSGNFIHYGYDNQGNRTEQSIYSALNEHLFFQRFDYQGPDRPGRLWKTINPDNTYTEYFYDAGGNIESVGDPAGKTTVHGYDILNRLTAVTRPGNVVTTYGYDRNDNLTTVTDAENRTTTYTYDDPGRLLKTVSPDTNATTYTYDVSGNLIFKTDANAVTTTYIYDVLNRLTDIYYPESAQNVRYTYDEGLNGRGRLTGISDPSGTTAYEYDHNGLPSKEIRTVNGIVFITRYVYTPAGRLSAIHSPNGRVISYTYDAAGRVSKVTSLLEGVESVLADNIAWLPFGPPKAIQFGNGLTTQSGFDQLYRPESILTGTVQGYEYTRDLSGNITGIADTLDLVKSQAFVYDDLYRLTGASGVYESISYAYDSVGNRLSKTHNGLTESYTYIAGTNKLADVNGNGFNYDANGNTSETGNTTYTYNQNNRLISAAENGATLGEYVYNALGQRVVKTAGGKETIFLYDPWGNLIAEADNDGNMINEYFYLNGRLLAAVKADNKVKAIVDVDPDTLNLNSNGRWITAFIKLPEEYDVNDIDPATVILNGTVYAEKSNIADNDNDGIPDLMVKFDRRTVCDILAPSDEVEITIEGNGDGFGFVGTDTIRVISEGKRHRNRTVEPILTIEPISTTLQQKRKLYFYHPDHLGTPQMMTDENGEVAWKADYMPFGQVNISIDEVEDHLRFAGQYYDTETGLHYNCFRYYDPKTGRYLTPDPIGLAGGINLYAYVLNDPVNLVDPLGLYLTSSQQLKVSFVSGIGSAIGGLLWGAPGSTAGGAVGGFITTLFMEEHTWQDVANSTLTGGLAGLTGSGIANLLEGTMMHSMKASATTGAISGMIDALLMSGDPVCKQSDTADPCK